MEASLKASGRLVNDPELLAYLNAIVCRVETPYCEDIRIYVVDTPYFNATMTPNGMMQVWSGLLLRTENEAQVAYILGHEMAHFTRRHSLQRWVDIQNKANAAAVFSMATSVAGVGYAGQIGEMAALASILAYSREQEREADMIGARSVMKAGYDPKEAVRVWEVLRAERAASNKPDEHVFLSTHPGVDDRIASLRVLARESGDTEGHRTGQKEFMAIASKHWDDWLSDELTRGEFGESEVLLDRLLAQGENTGLLRFYRGELYRKRGGEKDMDLAIQEYELALKEPDAPARTHRSLAQALIAVNRKPEAKLALEQYLLNHPEASDRKMIKYQIEKLR
jgi:predicted Zn-dependent protease